MPILDYRGITNYVDNSLPNDLGQQRRHIWEYLYTFGQPVVVRTVFNQDEIINDPSMAIDPTFDNVYGQGLTWASNDKGTPFGFGPPIFTYIVLGDAMVDDQTPNRTGEFKVLMPSMIAPWTPHIKDGDLIIAVDATVNGGVSINGTGDRYIVQQVNPVTMRGLFRSNSSLLEANYDYIENTDILLQQNMQAVRLERTNPLYQITVDGS